MVRILVEVINGVVLFVLHQLTQLIKMIWSSHPQDCLEDVLKLLLEFLLGSDEGVLLGLLKPKSDQVRQTDCRTEI